MKLIIGKEKVAQYRMKRNEGEITVLWRDEEDNLQPALVVFDKRDLLKYVKAKDFIRY